MGGEGPAVAVFGAGAPLSTALAAKLRLSGFDATCISGLSRRPGAAERTVVYPVWNGEAPAELGARRGRQRADVALLLDGLASGRLDRLVVLSSAAVCVATSAQGSVPPREDGPPAPIAGDSAAGDAAVVEHQLLAAGAVGVTVLRPAALLGPGCEAGLLSRHLAGARLLVVRGTAPRWQVCHVDDLGLAIATVLTRPVDALPGPAVVASTGLLDQSELEAVSGRRRLELPVAVAEATAARLRRTRLSPAAPEELTELVSPAVVPVHLLAGLGFVPRYDAAGAVRAHLGMDADAPVLPSSAGVSAGQTATLAGATVAIVGSAALVRRVRRQRGRRS